MDSLLDGLFGEGEASNSSFRDDDVPNQSKHYCNYCDLSFSNGSSLCAHMLNRHVTSHKKLFFCFACRDSFEKLDDLEKHASIHCQNGKCSSSGSCSEDHSIDEMVRMKLVCDFCPYTDVNIASYQIHCLVCTNNPSNKNYTPTNEGRVCPTCNQVFNTNAYMLKHIAQKHSGPTQDEIVKKHVCEECGRRFVSNSSLAGHKKVHNKPTAVNFTNSKAIMKPQERALKINGHTNRKPANNRPLKVPATTLFKAPPVVNESQPEGPVEDMPDFF